MTTFNFPIPQNGAEFDRRVEVDRDQGMVAVADSSGAVHVVDTFTWERRVVDQQFGNIRGMTFHPNRQHITIFVEGNMEVVDIDTGISLHSVPISNPTDGHWLDEEQIVVGTGTGLWTIITISTEELVEIARERQPRTFTANECVLYGIDPCPTADD